jgi:hypothetical protein
MLSDIVAVFGLILFVFGVIISLPPMLALTYGSVKGWQDGTFNLVSEKEREIFMKQAAKEERFGVLLAIAGTFIGIIGLCLK